MKRRLPLLFLGLLVAGFGAGVIELLELRLEHGDVYPEDSSLRADPLGAKAFYEGLEGLPGVPVRRNFRPLRRLRTQKNATLLFLGADAAGLEYADAATVQKLEAFVREGGRLVIALAPGTQPLLEPTPEKPAKATKGQGRNPRRTPAPEDAESEEGSHRVSLPKRWQFQVAGDSPPAGPVRAIRRHTTEKEAFALPRSLPWRSGNSFEKLAPAWRVLYAHGTSPVLLERSLGKGTIVLSSDSSFARNASLRTERSPELLAWLVGAPEEIVFDETHLRLSETPGVAALARQYRLTGLAAGILLLAALFVWKNAVPFVPAWTETNGQTESVRGKQAAEALSAVLRRHIAASEILRVCYEEWKKSFAGGHPDRLARVGEIEAALGLGVGPAEKPVQAAAAYRKASEILAKTKGRS